jgi:hypothetical protein
VIYWTPGWDVSYAVNRTARRWKQQQLHAWLRWVMSHDQPTNSLPMRVTPIREPPGMNPMQKQNWVNSLLPPACRFFAQVYVARRPFDIPFERTGVAVNREEWISRDNTHHVYRNSLLFPCSSQDEAERCVWLALGQLVRRRQLSQFRCKPSVDPSLLPEGLNYPGHWTLVMKKKKKFR